MANQIQLRRDTSANWLFVNPVLAEGEMGIETNTNYFKIGNGLLQWTGLTYVSGPNFYTTASTLNNSIVNFNRNDVLSAYSVNLSGLTGLNNYLPLSGGVLTGPLTATTVSATTFYGNGSQLTGIVAGATFTGGTVTGATTFTGGLSANTFSATTFYGDGSHLSGVSSSNYYTTASTLNNSTVSFSRNDALSAYSVNLSGLTGLNNYLPLSGGVLTGGITGTTISATTFYGNGSQLTGIVAGATFTGGTVTGATTFTGGLSANTFSATTFYGDGSHLSGIASGSYLPISGGTLTGPLVINSTLNITGGTTGNTLNLSSFTAATENIVTTNGSTLLQNYMQVDSEYIFDTTLIVAIINPISWVNSVYTGTTVGAVEGQIYNGQYYVYNYQNGSFTRMSYADYPVSIYATTSTASTGDKLIIINSTSATTIVLPQAQTMQFSDITVKSIGGGITTISASTSTIDGSINQVLNQYDGMHLFSYNNNYYII